MTLIERGRLHDALVSPRSAKEYGLQTNAANGGESPDALDLAAGALEESELLAALDTGLYVGDLHYLLQVWEYHHQIVEAICMGDYKSGYEALVAHTDLLYQRP